MPVQNDASPTHAALSACAPHAGGGAVGSAAVVSSQVSQRTGHFSLKVGPTTGVRHKSFDSPPQILSSSGSPLQVAVVVVTVVVLVVQALHRTGHTSRNSEPITFESQSFTSCPLQILPSALPLQVPVVVVTVAVVVVSVSVTVDVDVPVVAVVTVVVVTVAVVAVAVVVVLLVSVVVDAVTVVGHVPHLRRQYVLAISRTTSLSHSDTGISLQIDSSSGSPWHTVVVVVVVTMVLVVVVV